MINTERWSLFARAGKPEIIRATRTGGITGRSRINQYPATKEETPPDFEAGI
jgi:hypothetical protein